MLGAMAEGTGVADERSDVADEATGAEGVES